MTQDHLFYGIFGIGILLAAVRIVLIMFRLKINEIAFVKAIQKLALADNLERAIKLCRAAPAALSTRGTQAVLEAFQNKVTDSLALREAFDHGLGGFEKAAGKFGVLPWLGLAVTLLGAIWGYTQGYEPLHPIYRPGVVALVISLIAIRMGATLKRNTAWARDQIINTLQEVALNR